MARETNSIKKNIPAYIEKTLAFSYNYLVNILLSLKNVTEKIVF